MHHLTPDRLNSLLASSEVVGLSADAKERLNWIAAYTIDGSSVSELCAKFHIARSTFHRWIKRFDPNDLSTLEEQDHTPTNTRGTNIDQATADLIRQYRERSPLMGKETISELLKKDHNVEVSASSVGRIIERDGLYFAATPLHWKKRTQYRAQDPRSKKQDPNNSQLSTLNSQISPVESEQPTSVVKDVCHCFWCSFWKSHGRSLRRTLGLASIAINIAIIGLYLATAFWEHQSGEALSANIQLHQAGTVSNLDAPPFNEQ